MKTHIHLTAPRAYRNSPPSDSLPGRPRIALYLSLGLTLLPNPLFAQSWYTVDDFQLSPGKFARCTGLAKDPAGIIIYSAGDAVDASGVRHHLVFESTDSGTNWSVSDDYTGAADSIQVGGGSPSIASDQAGNLYASDGGTANGSGAWFVRSLPAGGSTWVTVDLTTNSPGPNGLATDSAGNVYMVGSLSGFIWLVRKGTPASTGISWANVDDFTSPFGTCAASSVFCHPTAGVFVVGYSPVATGKGFQNAWTVRRSQNGGASWSTVDTFQLTAQNGRVSGPSYAQGVGADATGNLYVVGNASSWIVRKSANPGALFPSWATVDNYQEPRGYPAPAASAFASDSNGNLFVTGEAANSGGPQWVTRESVGGTGTWNTVDTFTYPAYRLFVNAALGDGLGNVFVAGQVFPLSGGGFHWLVRKN